MNKLYPVYTLKNECHDCYKCVRECHAKAIKIENGHASVLSEKCIACGSCVKACPANAKRVRYDIEKVKTLFRAKKDVYVSLAPTWAGAFDFSSNKMIGLLKKLGFKDVSETALGAQEVSIETAKLLKEGKNGLYISSACPAIVDYIRLYNPKFTPNITPVASPALTHAKILKETFGHQISIVFIGPCIAKKNEADRHPELIDVALTFEELNFWLNEEFIKPSDIPNDEKNKFVPESSFEGALYPIEGGMNETIKQVGIEEDVQLLNISSLTTFEKALKGLNPDKIDDKKVFIEALSCDGGCVNGPCVATNKPSISITSDILSNAKEREKVPTEPKVVVKENYQANPVESIEYPIEQILSAMKKIGKHNEADELNCGGCGYPTCRDLAKALISGEAEPSMCVSYMRKIAMRKAAAMLRCMPSGIVMVDQDLNVVEANDSFLKMFCGDMYEIFANRQDGLVGASIDRIIDFSDIFKTALKSGKDIHKERYPVKNKLYDITAFTIEKNAIVGAIITDVTQTEMGREKIALKAQEVISKNISIVQDIACLLGEHMVETELLLNSIASDFDTKEEEE
ncbi:MAG: [Fe-Fe] hydrogenase large subunit C-terminal domain-containing protein [Candidatus Gastranaerophilales bacterium]|nr:[Fe-Fe] hydrogenase large subunit C-terminal domain-containing protein [Candidatus Gastranaerophilales bacterium]